MRIDIGQLRGAEVIEEKKEKEVVIKVTEMDGSYYGGTTDIKMPAKSFEMLEQAIVENWLEKKKSTE